MLRAREADRSGRTIQAPETGPSQALINRTSGREREHRSAHPGPGCEQHRGRRIAAPVALLRRPISEELAVALCQSLALEGRERLAELISACVPHASNRLGIRSSETPHEQSVVAEVLLQFRPRPNTRAMPASLHRHHARGCLRTRAADYTCATG